MNDQTSKYFDATQYAYAVLGGDASRYFPRLHRLSRYNSPEELRAIVDGWRPAAPPPPPAPDSWQPGATWGSAGAVRVARDRGIIWKIRCPCGQLFEVSCNDTVPENRRKCPNCIRADELSDARRVLVFKLEAIAQTVLVWYRDHGKLVWDRVWKACHRRGINDQNFAKELNALAWTKIAEKAGSYRDRGFRVSAWLGRVVDNCLKDFFKVNDNRERLAPTGPLVDEVTPAPATKPEEVMPARPVRPEGASPDDNNPSQANWDRRQKWNG